MRIDVRRVAAIKEADRIIGNQVKAKVVKNKVAPPFRDAHFDIMFDGGISREGDLIDLAVKLDVVQKQGAWFRYDKVQLGQGRENSKTFLADNPDLFEEIRQKILEISGFSQTPDKKDAAGKDDASAKSDAKAADAKAADKNSAAEGNVDSSGHGAKGGAVSKSAPASKVAGKKKATARA